MNARPSELTPEQKSHLYEQGWLHLGATSDGLSIYKAVGYDEPRFVNLEVRAPFRKSSVQSEGLK